MDDVWFGCVVRIFDVSEILSRAKDLEGEGIEEFSLAEDTMGRFDGEPCFFMEVIR